jgi:hypothetical protein
MAERNKGGRPPKLVVDEKTLDLLEGLGRIQATTKEAAAVLKVSEPTFIKFVKQHIKAQEAFESGKESGRASLRRLQWKAAEGGNTTMMIWLGKQWLGQTDKVANEISGDAAFLGMLRHVSGERT